MNGNCGSIICRIADLNVEIPTAGGMALRCQEYLTDQNLTPDLVLDAGAYQLDRWSHRSYEMACYMESARCFYGQLLRFNGLYLHASAVEYQGKAYLFSGPSTVGKSTHTRLWQSLYGEAAQVFNDDKPALRLMGERWYAYGTPWCGKDGIHQNTKVPLAGICFLKQGEENRICRLRPKDAVALILSQTIYKFGNMEDLEYLLAHLDKLVQMIPVFRLENRPEVAAAKLSSETMCLTAMQMEL